jgi:predicted Zn-dependent protease
MGKEKGRKQNHIFTFYLIPFILFISAGLLVIFTNFHSSATLPNFNILTNIYSRSNLYLDLYKKDFVPVQNLIKIQDATKIKIQKKHPLPPSLARWIDTTNSGDYFDQVQLTQAGYLIWSLFPVSVYVETPKILNTQQAENWVNTVLQATKEWNSYLPLQVVEKEELADIAIFQKSPPLRGNPPRARSAETRYELYTKNNILYHRFKILLSPSQVGEYLLAATRHEMGHALGIWGHSQLENDVMYFSQVGKPPLISPRDVNTLKRVYEQETTLGIPRL